MDAGTARISRYSHRTKVQRLPIERISQASANQRAGRCGRVADGICIRLYSQNDFESRPEFTDPEILRTNLAAVILQMTSLGLGDIAAFPFVEPPEARAITDGLALLAELGALEDARPGDRGVPRLTRTGRDLARLPIDPRLGRMVLEAQRNGCLHDVLVVVAALSVQDPRERPLEKREQAAQLHARFRNEQSDFLTYLNLWSYLQHLQRDLSSSAFRRRVKAEMLHFLRIREWQDTYSQLRRVARDLRFSVEGSANPPKVGGGTAVPRHPGYDADAGLGSLSAQGCWENGLKEVPYAKGDTAKGGAKGRGGGGAAERGEQVEYLGAGGASSPSPPDGPRWDRRSPDWVVAGRARRDVAGCGRRVVATTVDPRWIETARPSTSCGAATPNPAGARKRAAVHRHRARAPCYGVPDHSPAGAAPPTAGSTRSWRATCSSGTPWSRGTRGPTTSSSTRNREAAGRGRRSWEHRARRRDIVVDDEVLFAFYDARVPADVVSGRHFDAWWKDERRAQPDLLTFITAMLVTRSTRQRGQRGGRVPRWVWRPQGRTWNWRWTTSSTPGRPPTA